MAKDPAEVIGKVSLLVAGDFADFRVLKHTKSLLCLKGATPSGAHVFLKCFLADYNGHLCKTEYDNLERVYNSQTCGFDSICPKPVATYVDDRIGSCIVTEWIDMWRGDKFFKMFMPIEYLRRVGIKNSANWLGRFHSLQGGALVPASEWFSEAVVQETVSRLHNISEIYCGFDADSAEAEIRRKIHAFGDFPLNYAFIHSDYSASNVFISLKRAIGFDFMQSRMAPASIDIASFLVSIMLYKNIRFYNSVRQNTEIDKRRFLAEYKKHRNVDINSSIDLFLLLEYIRRVSYSIKQSTSNKRKLSGGFMMLLVSLIKNQLLVT